MSSPRLLLALLPLLALVTLGATIGATADAQVLWTVYPSPVPLEQPIQLKLENRLRSSIMLASSAPWGIFTGTGSQVMLPVGLPVVVTVKPLATIVWTWNQLDSNSKPVPAGGYEARLAYTDSIGKKILKTPFTIEGVTFRVSGQATPGGRVQLDMHTPTSTGAVYQMACALGAKPGLPFATTRHLALNADPLFFLSILNPGGVFQNFAGTTSKSGYATGFVNIPKAAALKGITFHAAGVTLSGSAPAGIHQYSMSKPIPIK